MPSLDAQRLKSLPIRKTTEVWEVAAAPLPIQAPMEKGGSPEQLVICVCVSSQGGAAMADPQTARTFAPAAGLQALTRFALAQSRPGALSLAYLPARIDVGPMPPEAQQEIVAALSELGVQVEVKPQIALATNFIQHLTSQLMAATPMPPDAPPLMRAKGMTVERIAAFAEAAHSFWNAQPWRLFRGEIIWRITPAPKVRELRHCSVMGGAGEEFGLAFLPDPAAAMAMAAADPANFVANHTGTLWGATFDHVDQVPPADAALWNEHQIPLANADAFPFPIGMANTGRIKRPNPAILTMMEGLFRAFATLQRKDVSAGHFSRDVATFEGPRTLTLDAALKF